jgi:hypothetical protein
MHQTCPFSVDAILTLEAGALGAAILEPSGQQARILAEFVQPDNWISSLHRSVAEAIRRLVARECLPLEYASVIGELQGMGVLQSYTNGWALISSLGEGVVWARPMTRRIAELRSAWKRHREEKAK